MKDTAKPTAPASEALINYILNMTPEQCAKLVERLPLLEQLAGMTEKELIFSEVFLAKICGKKVSA